MLVLSRRIDETLIIGANTDTPIKVTLLGIQGGQARIGIDAPRDISVHREEVQKRIDDGDVYNPLATR